MLTARGKNKHSPGQLLSDTKRKRNRDSVFVDDDGSTNTYKIEQNMWFRQLGHLEAAIHTICHHITKICFCIMHWNICWWKWLFFFGVSPLYSSGYFRVKVTNKYRFSSDFLSHRNTTTMTTTTKTISKKEVMMRNRKLFA